MKTELLYNLIIQNIKDKFSRKILMTLELINELMENEIWMWVKIIKWMEKDYITGLKENLMNEKGMMWH